MSYCHLKLKIIHEDKRCVSYSICSIDFNKEHKWEELGIVEIDLQNGSYVHNKNELWEKYKIYPIGLFELSQDERKRIIEEKYKEYGCGRWAINVFTFIKNSLETKIFPDEKDLIS
jgi:hypothetical protein